jgi:thioredoxin reductase (NADPH)
VENYPGFPNGVNGFDLMQSMETQAVKFGLEIISGETVQGIAKQPAGFVIQTNANKYEARAIIIASGTTQRKLNVPGEAKFANRGVSYCATCDGPLFKGKDVAVAGGGNSAVEEALFLARFARSVTIIHRRDKLRASDIIQQRAFNNPKLKFIWNAVVTGIKGAKMVESITIAPVPGQQLKFQPPGESRQGGNNWPMNGIFIFIGTTPNTAFAANLLKLDEEGYLITDPDMRTSIAGIFGAGDVTSGAFRQIITACGDGARAVASAQHYLT